MAKAPVVHQSIDQVIEVPFVRQAEATQIFDLEGNVVGTVDNPLYVVAATATATTTAATGSSEIRDVTTPDKDQIDQVWNSLVPIQFFKGDDSDTLRWGLDTEEIGRTQPGLVRALEGRRYYDLPGIMAVMISRLRQQEELIAQLIRQKQEEDKSNG
jgi:hypothetical protein